METDYVSFFNSNIPFYEEETKRFFDETYGAINFEWFSKHVDIKYLRCIYYPSSTWSNYSSTVNEKYVYCAVSGDGSAIVHEFCHSFANPLADKLYIENAQFKKWCDDSVDKEKNSAYPEGYIMAREYVTRAYNCLYNYENDVVSENFGSFEKEKSNGFPYIEEIYNMILKME
jgi:putative hemolysin